MKMEADVKGMQVPVEDENGKEADSFLESPERM